MHRTGAFWCSLALHWPHPLLVRNRALDLWRWPGRCRSFECSILLHNHRQSTLNETSTCRPGMKGGGETNDTIWVRYRHDATVCYGIPDGPEDREEDSTDTRCSSGNPRLFFQTDSLGFMRGLGRSVTGPVDRLWSHLPLESSVGAGLGLICPGGHRAIIADWSLSRLWCGAGRYFKVGCIPY